MRRSLIATALFAVLMLIPAAAGAAPAESSSCVGQFSTFFAHGDAPHRSDVARDFAENAKPAGLNVYSHVAQLHGTLDSCFEQS